MVFPRQTIKDKVITFMANSKMHIFTVVIWVVIHYGITSERAMAQSTGSQESLLVRKCNDFNVTGTGDNPEWSKASIVTPLIIDYIKARPQWQLSLQVHKYINVP